MHLSHLIYFIKPSDLKGSYKPAKIWWLSLIHLSLLRLWEICPLAVKPCYLTRRKDPGWANDDWHGHKAALERETHNQTAYSTWGYEIWTVDHLNDWLCHFSSCLTFNKFLNVSNFGFISKRGMMLTVINIFCHMVITIVNEVIHENLLYYMENNKNNKYYLW